jgi:pyrroloquinoline-quinone synthase
MGVDREDVRSSSSNSATQAMLATYWQACTEAPVAAGVAAVYAYERQVPAVARAKVDGLKARYDVHDPRTLAFFEVHATLDEAHSAAERDIIARHGQGHEEDVLAATSAALDAWWSFLDAVTPEEG